MMRRMVILVAGIMVFGLSCAAQWPDLEGRWAMIQVYPQIAVLPFAGEVSRTSYVVQMVEIVQSGAALTLLDRYCLTHVEDGTPLVVTTIPRAFMASLRPQPRTAILSETDDGLSFVQAPYVEVRGALLEDEIADALPTEAADPRVIDQDGDGNPGLTVFVLILGIVEGETYIVQRVMTELTGTVVFSDRIEGTIQWTDEQSVLEASNPLLKVDTIGYPDPDPTAHRFLMVRVDENWTCDRLSEEWATLFNIELPDDAM